MRPKSCGTRFDLNKDYPLDFALLGDARLVLRQMMDMFKT